MPMYNLPQVSSVMNLYILNVQLEQWDSWTCGAHCWVCVSGQTVASRKKSNNMCASKKSMTGYANWSIPMHLYLYKQQIEHHFKSRCPLSVCECDVTVRPSFAWAGGSSPTVQYAHYSQAALQCRVLIYIEAPAFIGNRFMKDASWIKEREAAVNITRLYCFDDVRDAVALAECGSGARKLWEEAASPDMLTWSLWSKRWCGSPFGSKEKDIAFMARNDSQPYIRTPNCMPRISNSR